MRRSRLAVFAAILAIVAPSACSTGHDASPPAGTTAPSSASPASPASTARIDSLTGPPTPPACNAPTQVELHWSTHGARTVSLRINGGPVFATYPNGKADELVPLACNGRPQTYLLTAHAADGKAVTRSLTITPRQLSTS